MKKLRYGVFLLTVCALGMWLFLLPTGAESETEALIMPPAYTAMGDELPPELDGLLPDHLFSSSADEALAAAESMTDWQYLARTLLSAVGLRLSDSVALLASLIGLLLIAAALSRLRDSLGGTSGETFGFCLRLALYAAIVTGTAGMVGTVQAFFSSICSLTQGMIPAMGTLYALGGNLGQAALNEEILLIFLAVCQFVSSSVTPPVCALCLAFAFMDALGTRLTLAPLADQVKKWYTSLLGFVFFLLGLALSAQSVLTGRADTLGMRGVKYAVSNWIPVVGGAVAGTLGTVADSVSLLRGICGVSGIVMVALLLLPTLIELLLFRAVLRLSSTVAALLGCDGEGRLLSEIASLHGYLAAAASVCALMFVLALTLFVRSTAAFA